MTISRSLLFSLNCCFFISLFTFAGFHFARLRSQRDSRRLIGNAPRLMNTKSAFRLLITVAAHFVFWTLLNRFALDPDASVFLSHKTKLIRPMNLPVWLNMLNVHVIFACIAIALVPSSVSTGRCIIFSAKSMSSPYWPYASHQAIWLLLRPEARS